MLWMQEVGLRVDFVQAEMANKLRLDKVIYNYWSIHINCYQISVL